MTKKKVVIGMSGGVDSSVAAYLLKEQGYEVIGVTMRMWNVKDLKPKLDAEGNPIPLKDVSEDARKVAEILDIPFHVLDFQKPFKERVMDYFVEEYLNGRTPNPCVACNRGIKWQALLEKAGEFGADYIATGHYSRIDRLPNGRYALKRAAADAKDQTYALYGLNQYQLAHTLMPVGEYPKDEIRAIAEKIGLPVAKKKDSQEICFIPDNDYADFIERTSGKNMPKGNFVTSEGTVIGEHQGLLHYTIGQRKRLNLSMGHPVFVGELRPSSNEVVIVENEDLFKHTVYADQLNFMSVPDLEDEMEAVAKIRYNHKGAPCVLKKTGADTLECYFPEAQRAITPGQALVFYQGDYVMGGGRIVGGK